MAYFSQYERIYFPRFVYKRDTLLNIFIFSSILSISFNLSSCKKTYTNENVECSDEECESGIEPVGMVTVTELEEGTASLFVDGVDLGLPSGLIWASCNLGASNPSDFGDYYTFGKISPGSITISEYTEWEKELRGHDKMGGNPKYDAATAKLGDKWRTPSDKEFYELRTNCNWDWTVINGHSGFRITGPNGNSIFLPAAGIESSHLGSWNDQHGFSGSNKFGLYWKYDYSGIFHFEADNIGGNGDAAKSNIDKNAHTIRPVSSYSLEELGINPNEKVSYSESKIPTEPMKSKDGCEFVDLGLPSGNKWAYSNWGTTDPMEDGDKTTWDMLSGTAIAASWESNWKVPTIKDYGELINNTTWVRQKKDDKIYYICIGPNGNTLIFPHVEGAYWSSTPETQSYSFVLRFMGNINLGPSTPTYKNDCKLPIRLILK